MAKAVVCPSCEIPGVAKYVANGQTGTTCKACGWTSVDKVSNRVEHACADCGRSLGFAFYHEDKEVPTVVCPSCSKASLKVRDPRLVLVRYEVRCCGGCGTVMGWNDHAELSTEHKPQYWYCDNCKHKQR